MNILIGAKPMIEEGGKFAKLWMSELQSGIDLFVGEIRIPCVSTPDNLRRLEQEINTAHEKAVAEAVCKAKEEMREKKEFRDHAARCPKCGENVSITVVPIQSIDNANDKDENETA